MTERMAAAPAKAGAARPDSFCDFAYRNIPEA